MLTAEALNWFEPFTIIICYKMHFTKKQSKAGNFLHNAQNRGVNKLFSIFFLYNFHFLQ